MWFFESWTASECQPRRIREYCVIKGLWFDQKASESTTEMAKRMNYQCYLSTRSYTYYFYYILWEHGWLYCPFPSACLERGYFAFEVPSALNLLLFLVSTTNPLISLHRRIYDIDSRHTCDVKTFALKIIRARIERFVLFI